MSIACLWFLLLLFYCFVLFSECLYCLCFYCVFYCFSSVFLLLVFSMVVLLLVIVVCFLFNVFFFQCFLLLLGGAASLGPKTILGCLTPISGHHLKTHRNTFQSILERKMHINNCIIGCLLSWERTPNIYSKDLHGSLSFLHL